MINNKKDLWEQTSTSRDKTLEGQGEGQTLTTFLKELMSGSTSMGEKSHFIQNM